MPLALCASSHIFLSQDGNMKLTEGKADITFEGYVYEWPVHACGTHVAERVFFPQRTRIS